MNYDAKCSSHLAYSHLLSTYCLLCPLTPFSCLRCIHALWWICFTEGFWGSSWESRFGLSQEKPGNLCLDSQSCLFSLLSRPDSSTAPSIYWAAPFVSNRCMLCQGFCSLVCLRAAEKSSLTPQFVLVREKSKASLQTVEDSPIGKKALVLFYIVSSCTYPQQRYREADFNFCTFRDWVHFVCH